MASSNSNRERILNGERVHFSRTAAEADRTVQAEWIRAAAQKGARVELINAVISGTLDFEYITSEPLVILLRCQCTGRVVFSHATFKNGLTLSGTVFHKGVDFRGAKIDGDARLSHTMFLSGKTNFSGLYVSGNLIARSTQFRGTARPDFQGAVIGRSALLSSAKFEAGAVFSSMTVAIDAQYNGCVFDGKVTFRGASIGGIASFLGRPSPTMFKAEVDFSYANFQSVGLFRAAIFKEDASFGATKFLGNAFFGAAFDSSGSRTVSGATFACGADFTLTQFASLADFNNVSFGNKGAAKAQFNGVGFHSNAIFRGTKFKGYAGFNGARFDGFALFGALHPSEFLGRQSLDPAEFEGKVDFTGAQFALRSEFQEVEFKGVTSFAPAIFAGDAIFSGAQFRKGSNPSFNFAQFRGDADFTHALFAGRAGFAYASFRGLWFSEALPVPKHFLFWELVGRQPEIRKDHSQGEKQDSDDLLEEKEISVIQQGVPEQFQGTIDLRGCTYERIEVNWMALLRRSDGKPRIRPFDRQPYAQLEKAFRNAGRVQEADGVYLERRLVERQRLWSRRGREAAYDREEMEEEGSESGELTEHIEHRGPYSRATIREGLTGLGSWILDWIYWRGVRYGVRPFRLLLFAILLLCWGGIVFHHPGTVRSKSLANSTSQNQQRTDACPSRITFAQAIRFSLREFSPVELPLLKDCESSDETRFLLRCSDWAAFLRITGWIIVPIGIAALTGLLRRQNS